MFRFRQIKPQYLHMYEPTEGDLFQGVTQRMLDSAACLVETDQQSDAKIMKVFNYAADAHSGQDVEMRDDNTTNASPEQQLSVKAAHDLESILKTLQNYYSVIVPVNNSGLNQETLKQIVEKCNEGNQTQISTVIEQIR